MKKSSFEQYLDDRQRIIRALTLATHEDDKIRLAKALKDLDRSHMKNVTIAHDEIQSKFTE